ncbi:MAG: single-strand selective monofunctional uracil-DNA glycosylase [bacterium]|nr:single-strand selective monofunctional uracil-DNA glycosylase [bacterium]
MSQLKDRLQAAAKQLCEDVNALTFSEPVAVVYNPLEYAWEAQALYLERYGNTKKRVVFLGMNPGPWGMVQTGVPFGEIDAVKNWLGIDVRVGKPEHEHPKRPVTGFSCERSEVSGRRLWGFFKERFGRADVFFEHHFVANYCPLVFMEASSRNRTPDKLKVEERKELFAICDRHLQEVVEILEPGWLIGVGRFSERCAFRALAGMDVRIGQILHPSPASPAANRDWSGTVARQLKELGI